MSGEYDSKKKWNKKNWKHRHTHKGLLGRPVKFNPYGDEKANAWFLNAPKPVALVGGLPDIIYSFLGFKQCCVCGFKDNHGVVFERNGQVSFACDRDIWNFWFWFPFVCFGKDGNRYNPAQSLENFVEKEGREVTCYELPSLQYYVYVDAAPSLNP
jgi:hypothetical protein